MGSFWVCLDTNLELRHEMAFELSLSYHIFSSIYPFAFKRKPTIPMFS